MGASESKPGVDSQHVFKADSPVRFSEQLTNSLQASAATDSTRAKEIELQIQTRVTAELEKLLAQSSEKLSSISDSVSKEPFKPAKENPKPKAPESADSAEISWTEKPLLNRIGDFLSGGFGSSKEPEKPAFQPNLERSAVQKEIDELKKKLDGRKQIKEIDKGVKKAQDEVAECLKLNDRRPLDCWQEVENFKVEVGRLERQFVEKNGF